MSYKSYADLENRYKKDRRTIWRWWAKEQILEPPKRSGKVLLGWTDEQLKNFEKGEAL